MQLLFAVLVSGSGSNLQAIMDAAVADPDYGATGVSRWKNTNCFPKKAFAKGRLSIEGNIVVWEGEEP